MRETNTHTHSRFTCSYYIIKFAISAIAFKFDYTIKHLIHLQQYFSIGWLSEIKVITKGNKRKLSSKTFLRSQKERQNHPKISFMCAALIRQGQNKNWNQSTTQEYDETYCPNIL